MPQFEPYLSIKVDEFIEKQVPVKWMLIAYMKSGTLDVLIMEEDRLQAIGAAGGLMDLENEQVRMELMSRELC